MGLADGGPAISTPWLHRWNDLTVSDCGTFDICHCNRDCDNHIYWDHVGSITVSRSVASKETGVSRPGKNCLLSVPPFAFDGALAHIRLRVEATLQISVFGAETDGLQAAILAALPDFFEVTGDRVHATVGQRRLEASECVDNDVAFQLEAAKVGFRPVRCEELRLAEPAFCGDVQLRTAVEAGCRFTCNLCSDTRVATLMATVEVHVDDNEAAARVNARFLLLGQDPTSFLHLVFASASAPNLWVDVVTGPLIAFADPTAAPEASPAPSSLDGGGLALVLGAVAGASCLGLCSCAWCLRKRSRVAPAPEEAPKVIRSEGGYRFKVARGAWEPRQPQPQPQPGRKCPKCPRCPACFRWPRRSLRRIEGAGRSGRLEPGAEVELHGLGFAAYNGLTGRVLEGPNENGRWRVSVLVRSNASTEERQQKLFKEENLRVRSPV